MARTFTIVIIAASVLVGLALLGGLVWANSSFARQHPGERDFLVPWLAARTYLQYGDSPYSEQATQRAEIVYYGRLAVEGEDPLVLWLPLPLELFYFPLALIPDYALARGLWMTFLEIALAATAAFSMRLTGWKYSRLSTALLLLFSLFWFFGLWAVLQCNGIPFAALALVLLLQAVRDGQDELAGALLLPLFFFPGVTLGFLLYLFWWLLYHRRVRVLLGLAMSLAVLLTLAYFFIPGWFIPFLQGLVQHLRLTPGLSLASLLGEWWPVFGPRFGWGLTGLLALGLLFEWGRSRRQGFRHFLWTASLTLAASPWLGIPIPVGSYLLLFLPLILEAKILQERWSRPGRVNAAALLLWLVFLLLWGMALLAELSGPTGTFPRVVFMLLPLMLITGLLWMRWWAIRPPRTSLELQQ